jgi:tetratricopeptide (TPR) repeat protein
LAPIKLAGCVLLPVLLSLSACNSDPRVASRNYVERGNRYLDKGKYKEASLLYRRALKRDAKYAEAWYQLGLTNNQLGLYAEARKDFARAMDLDPANIDALARLGDLDLLFYAADQQRNKELLADLKDLAARLLKKDKKSYDGLRFSGEIALIEKDLATAIQKFEEANRAKPYQRELVLALAQALEAGRQDERAEQLALDLIEHDKAAGAIYDFLYTNYLRTHRAELAEEILRRKIANNTAEGAYVMQLAFHYYMTNRRREMSVVLERLTSKPGAYAEARLQVGDFYARIRELDQALAQYQLGENENPKSRRVYRKKMAEVLATQGKGEAAAKLVDELLQDDPRDSEAIGLHAALLIGQGKQSDVKEAIGELEPLARKPAASALVHYDLGRAYLASGPARLEQAHVQFSEALRIDPKHVGARLSLAEVDLARGENGQAVSNADQVLSAEPANAEAMLLRARGWMKMGEDRKAREDLATVLATNPKWNDARRELAELDLRQRRFEEAETLFQALLADGDARGLTGAIECEVGQGRWAQAIQMAAEQVQRKPESAEYRAKLADLLLRAAKYGDAAEQFQELIDRSPSSEELYLRLGEAKARLNDARGAMAAFEKARELTPGDATPDLDLGILHDQARNFAEARQAYEAALRKQPDNSTALNNLAFLEAEQGVDLDQALAYAQRARAKRPDDVNVIDTLGLIYVKKNLTEDGLRMLREVVKLQPDNAMFRLHLALAWYQKGDRTMARQELEAARRSNPTAAEQNQIRQLRSRVG